MEVNDSTYLYSSNPNQDYLSILTIIQAYTSCNVEP